MLALRSLQRHAGFESPRGKYYGWASLNRESHHAHNAQLDRSIETIKSAQERPARKIRASMSSRITTRKFPSLLGGGGAALKVTLRPAKLFPAAATNYSRMSLDNVKDRKHARNLGNFRGVQKFRVKTGARTPAKLRSPRARFGGCRCQAYF